MTVEVRTFTYVKKRDGKEDLTREVEYIVDRQSGFVTDEVKIVVPLCNYAQIGIAEEDADNEQYIAERLTQAIQKWARVEQSKQDEAIWRANNPHQFRLYSGVGSAQFYVYFAEILAKHTAEAGIAGIRINAEYGDRQKLEDGTLYATVYAARPGRIIGKAGATAKTIREELKSLTGREISLNILDTPLPFTEVKFIAPPVEGENY